MERLRITGGTVLTMAGPTEIFADGLVAVAGGEIVYAGDRSNAPPEVLAPGWADRDLDGAGRLILPGLINVHTHAAMTLLRGYADDMRLMEWLQTRIWPVEEQLTGDDVYWGTALACAEMLLSGTTCFNDMYFFMSDAARAVQDTGARAVLCRGIIGGGEDARQRLEEARQLHRDWHGGAGGRITTMLAPHAPYTVPPDILEIVAATAAELGTGVHIHLAETAGEVDACWEQHNTSPIRLMEQTGITGHQLVGAHCVHVSDEDIDLLAQISGGVAHCPVSNLKLACGIAPVTAMRRAGVNVGIATDGTASANQLNLWGEIRLMALLQKNQEGDPAAFTAYDALEVATIGGARVLGLDDRIGTLEPGKRADLILVRTDRAAMQPVHDPVSLLAYSTNPSDVDTVLVDGRVVVAGGRLATMEVDAIIARAAEQARDLLGRA